MVDVVICSNRPVKRWEQYQRVCRELPESTIILVCMTVNYGYMRQRGLELVKSPVFLMLDDDIVFKRKDVEAMLGVLNSSEDIGAVNPRLFYTQNPELVKAQRKLPFPLVVGGFSLFKTDIIRKIGYDEEMNVGEDGDLRKRVISNGYGWVHCHKAQVYHQDTPLSYMFRRWRQFEQFNNPLKQVIAVIRRTLTEPTKVFIYTRNVFSSLTVAAYNLIELMAYLKVLVC